MTIPDGIFNVCSCFEITIYIYIKRNIKDGEFQLSMQQLADMLGTTKGKARHAIDKLIAEKYLSRTIFARFSRSLSADNQELTWRFRTKPAQNPHKKSIKEREMEFAESLRPYLDKYGREMLNKFYKYWTQVSPNGTKMLFEKQKAFQIPNRLSLWASKNSSYGNQHNRESARAEEQRQRLNDYAALAAEYASQADGDDTKVAF